MNHQGLRRNMHCVLNVGLRKRLPVNLFKRGFKVYDLLVIITITITITLMYNMTQTANISVSVTF